MTYDDAFKVMQELRARFDAPFSIADRERIAELYEAVMGRALRRTNCQQCYHDAVIEVYCFMQKNKKMADRSKYVMRNGFIIQSPVFRSGKIFTNDNLTDEVAEEYMEMFPNKRAMFDLRVSTGTKEAAWVVTPQPKKKRATRKKKTK